VIVRRREGGKAGEHILKLGERLIKKRIHHTAVGQTKKERKSEREKEESIDNVCLLGLGEGRLNKL